MISYFYPTKYLVSKIANIYIMNDVQIEVFNTLMEELSIYCLFNTLKSLQKALAKLN